jgi:23S rRNA pseudouridine1911/1915/1917 synthase
VGNKGFDIRTLEEDEHHRAYEVLPHEEGLRLDRFLHGRLHWLSRSVLQRMITEGVVSTRAQRLAGAPLKSAARVAEGDRFEVTVPANPKDLEKARQNPPLHDRDILFEDEVLLVVNKPAGVPVHPVGKNLHRTVLTALHHRYRRPEDPDHDIFPRLIHRLDLETSGVLLVAKDEAASKNLTAQFRARTVKKEYVALVYGDMHPGEGEVNLPLGPDENSRVPYKRMVRREGGREAVTRYQVLERGSGLTLVHLFPRTGRKHQLRIHMAALGHAIVGDKIYGPDEAYYFKARTGPPDEEDLKELLLPRQALHAYRLSIRHPKTEQTVRFEAPWPVSFDALLQRNPDRDRSE